MRDRRRVLIFAALIASLLGSSSRADTFPDHPVRLVVPQPPGGPADAAARLLAQGLSQAWSVPVIVENKAGADMQIAARYVARAPADGYTLMLASVTFTMSRGLYSKLPYDPFNDFTWISGFGSSPLMLVVSSSDPSSDVAELIAAARRAPQKQTFASSSSLNFVAGEMLKKAAHIEALHVPYKGSSASVLAISSGEATWSFDSLASSRPLLDAGRMKVLAVTGSNRMSQLPNVPTLDESGLKNMSISSWFGVVSPAGVDATIAKKANSDIQRVIADPEFQQRMKDIGMVPMAGSMSDFSHFVKSEFARYEDLIKSNGLQAN